MRHVVLSPIRLDGVLYQPGESIALTDAQHRQLRASGAINPVPVAEPSEPA